jgi:small subunit ribosomal protein S6
MLNQYETVFILNPVLTDEQVTKTVEKFVEVLKENGAEILHLENWGLKKLAYSIQKKSTGFYHMVEFKAPGTCIGKLELELKRDERVLRFLTVAMDKDHVEFAAKRRAKIAGVVETHKTEEVES